MGYLKYDLPTKVISWVIVMIYIGILGTIFLRRMRKADTELVSQKLLYRSMGLVFYCYVMVRVFFLISDFERDANNTTPLHYQFVAIGYIFTSLAFLNLLYFGEKFIIRKSKFILTYITISVLIIESVLVFIPEMFIVVRLLSYGLSYALLGLVFILFLRMTIKSTGSLRRNFLFTLLGLSIIATSGILEIDALLSTGDILPWISPLLFGAGATVVVIGLRNI